MLVRIEGAQSQGAVYRRVVLRNAICTAGIIISYVISAVIAAWIFLTSPPVGSDKVWHQLSFTAYYHVNSPCILRIA